MEFSYTMLEAIPVDAWNLILIWLFYLNDQIYISTTGIPDFGYIVLKIC